MVPAFFVCHFAAAGLREDTLGFSGVVGSPVVHGLLCFVLYDLVTLQHVGS